MARRAAAAPCWAGWWFDTWAGRGHRARIAWVTATEAGLAFSQSFDMNAIADPALTYLKRFWSQRVV